MKRISFFTLCILVLFLNISTAESMMHVMALPDKETAIDDLITDKNMERDKYSSQIEGILSRHASGQNSQNTTYMAAQQTEKDAASIYDLSGAYQVHILEPLLISILKETGSFASAITDTVQWKIPVTTGSEEIGLAVLLEKNGSLSYVGMMAGENARTWMVKDEAIRNAVMKSDGLSDTVDSLKIAHSYLYETTFVWLTAGEEEYLIPFSYYADRIHLENGKLYTVSEITGIFDKYFDEQKLIDSPGSYGGVPFKEQPIIPAKLVISVVFASIVGIIGLAFFRRPEKKILNQ
ncbi:MAG: hypothetical protein K2N94_00535 [Lachnospiraceae bacterium]|nr:hypothetical protein [Lachnospiraceae bacterium]